MSTIRYTPAAPKHVPAVVAMIRENFEPVLIDKTIYGTSGVEAYVASQIVFNSKSAARSNVSYSVAVKDSGLIGSLILERSNDAVFISYITVKQFARQAGVANQLLTAGLKSLEYLPDSMMLDVGTHNTIARSWYERLGFVPHSSIDWVEVSQPVPGSQAQHFRPVIVDYPQAEVLQQTFGFSRFGVITPDKSFQVGRIGRNWFRIDSIDAPPANELLDWLQCLDPGRAVIAVIERPFSERNRAEPSTIATFVRMRGNVKTILGNLGRRSETPKIYA